jgi:hypothetical protein
MRTPALAPPNQGFSFVAKPPTNSTRLLPSKGVTLAKPTSQRGSRFETRRLVVGSRSASVCETLVNGLGGSAVTGSNPPRLKPPSIFHNGRVDQPGFDVLGFLDEPWPPSSAQPFV